MKKQPEKSSVHFTIPKNLKEDWKKRFEERGHNTLKAGILSAVFNYLYLPGVSYGNFNETLEELQEFLKNLYSLDDKLSEKISRVSNLDYVLPEISVDNENISKIKADILEKLGVYQPVGITLLAQLLQIPGEDLLSILKLMLKENSVEMTDKYEWIKKKHG